MFADWPPQAIVGLIAAGATLAGVFLGFFLSLIRDKWQEGTARRRLATALIAEIDSLVARYDEVFGKIVRAVPPGQPLPGLGAVITGQNFFAVFDQNTDKLGLFKRDDVDTVVRAYTMGKGYAETLRGVADRVDGLEQKIALLASQAHPGAATLQGELDQFLVYSADLLKGEDARLMELMKQTRTALRKYADC